MVFCETRELSAAAIGITLAISVAFEAVAVSGPDDEVHSGDDCRGASGWGRSMIRRVGRVSVFRAVAWAVAAGCIACVTSAAVLAGEASDTPPICAETLAALRAFELRVHQIHARRAARAEARGELSALASPDEGPSATPSEKAPDLSPPPRLQLRGVLDRMAVSAGWQVEHETWRAGIRLRFSRSVEFDPATDSYALVEATEITPAVRFRIVALARPTKVVVRRTGYGAWEDALFASPSRWLFVDRPNRPEEAQQLAPGTAVTLSNETTFFIGADVSTNLGAFPLGIRAGPFASGEYFTRLERLPLSTEKSGDREWVVSVGGLISRGLETALNLRTPDLARGRTLRLAEAHWRRSSGIRFLLRAGPLDLRGNPETAAFLRTAMAGVSPFRFFDVPLLGANLKTVGRRAQIGPNMLEKLEHLPNFERLLAAASKDPAGIPYTESISRFAPRARGESGLGLWAFLYGLNLTSDWYAEESLAAPSEQPATVIFSYPLQRRWDRGWLFFPRKTQDIQMLTVQDGQGEELFTEVSLEVEDARAHRREGQAYRAQVLRFITRALAEKFPQRIGTDSPAGPKVVRGELPDLDHAPKEDERLSIYLRIILGPRFHEQLMLRGKGGKERKERITEWQKQIMRTIRRRGDALEAIVRTYGAEDLFVNYRIAITPYARRKESPRPTTVFTGFLGDPGRIPSYRRLRNTFDAAGTIF